MFFTRKYSFPCAGSQLDHRLIFGYQEPSPSWCSVQNQEGFVGMGIFQALRGILSLTTPLQTHLGTENEIFTTKVGVWACHTVDELHQEALKS